MTTDEVSKATGIGLPTIYAALHSGELNGTKLDGKHWIIMPEDCLVWSRLL